ncbi:MAG: hypothetical protein HQM13_11410 [SAR324 cluster bacterium]|nr:hypothetical protein [SAR324 cluster bacterium]
MEDRSLTREDQEFLDSVHEDLEKFLKGDQEMYEFQPMNSYRRRLVHNLVSDFKLKSHSVGEEERFVCVIKTENAAVPKKKSNSYHKVHDYGMQTFWVAPKTRIILRSDGSFGIPLKSDRLASVDERVVERSFRIRNNKIVCQGEEGW